MMEKAHVYIGTGMFILGYALDITWMLTFSAGTFLGCGVHFFNKRNE